MSGGESGGGGDGGGGDAFITELLEPVRTGKRIKEGRLDQARKDHAKLMEVVKAFGTKVGGMIDKQRVEFMTAYEHHMLDVQKELQVLREKVGEVTNDATLKAKLSSLDHDQKRFKSEALSLDTETLTLRKRLRNMAGVLHSVEKERDWLLKRLRQAKKHYNGLLKERSELLSFSNSTILDEDGAGASSSPYPYGLDTYSMHSGSNDSAFSVLVGKKAKNALSSQNFRAKVEATYSVNRDQAMLATLPHILPANNNNNNNDNNNSGNNRARGMQLSSSMGNLSRGGKNRSSSPLREELAAERLALGKLVALRARQEAIRDFVAQCASSCDKGPFARIPRRPLQELMQACNEIIADEDQEAREEERLMLAFQLAAIPEAYYALSDILAGKRGESSTAEAESLKWPKLHAVAPNQAAFTFATNELGEIAALPAEVGEVDNFFYVGPEEDEAQQHGGVSRSSRGASRGGASASSRDEEVDVLETNDPYLRDYFESIRERKRQKEEEEARERIGGNG